MTYPDRHPADTTPASITVRATAGALRIIPVWQALGQWAAHAKRTRVHRFGRQGFDEMTVTFDAISALELTEIARWLSAQSWVVAASLHTMASSSSDMRCKTDAKA